MNLVVLSNPTVVEQKLVNFNGAEIMAAKCDDGKTYIGVSWVCQGIGLSENQTKAQRDKINADIVLSKGGRIISILTNGGKQDVLCIELGFLPLWLAKISANIVSDPEIQDRLVEYQLRAKDVLAEAFTDKEPKAIGMTEYQKMVAKTREDNSRVRKANILLKIAGGYNGNYRQVLESYATKIITGEHLLPLPESERKTYSATEIGQELGISSNKVGILANRHNLKNSEYGKLFHDKSRHSSKEVESFRYFDNVIPVLKTLLG